MKKDQSSTRYYQYFRPYRILIFFATLLTLSATAMQLLNTQFMSKLVAQLSDHDASNIFRLTIIMFGISAIRIASSFCSSKMLLNVNNSVAMKIHWDLASALAVSSSETVQANSKSEISERLREGTTYVNSVQELYSQTFSILTGLVALTYSLVVCWQLSLLSVVCLAVIFVVTFSRINLMIEKRGDAKTAEEKSRQLILEILDAFLAVKSQNLVSGLKPHFAKRLETEYEKNITLGKVEIFNRSLSQVMLMLYEIFFLALGGYFVTHNILAFQAFVAMFIYKNNIDNLVNSALKFLRYKAEIDLAKKRMDEIAKHRKISPDIFGTTHYFPGPGKLSIENLSVQIDGKIILDNFSITIPSGKFVGVVGKSGCGKSTLLKILAHQLTPQSGNIFMDGYNLFDLNQSSFYRCMKLAPQEAYIFSMSVRDNMLLSNPNASEEEMWTALHACACKQLVEANGGLNSVISPGSLSGGEKQRLALSRVAILGAKVLLLDESTSALDAESQSTVLETIHQATKTNHTVVMVAHRLTTLKDADMIIVMDCGKVLEVGTYSELYQNSPVFHSLVEAG